jgi:glutamate synthase domain-containing protein 1
VFLPARQDLRQAAEAALVGRASKKKGSIFLGWRKVPVNPEAAGDLARRVMPVIRMAFVGKADNREDATAFERRLVSHAQALPKTGFAARSIPKTACFTSPACRREPWSTKACCWPTR